jgi:citrate lyase subunit beta/citryl-CoA lyase
VADYSDVDGMRAIIRNSRRFGFEGASCIHPSIVSILNKEFRPSEKEVAEAQRMIQGFEAAVAEGRASLEIDGKMVDYPVVFRAQQLLDQDTAIRQREARMKG